YGADRRDNHGYLTLHQIGRHFLKPAIFTVRPREFDCDVPALCVAGLSKALSKCCELAGVRLRRTGMQEADHWHPRLPRPRSKRPRRRAANQCYKGASLHSITSSASASNLSGIWRPSVLAVLRLITVSYLVGACTGSSAGFSPLRMRSTYVAARRKLSVRSTPCDSKPPTSAKKRNG